MSRDSPTRSLDLINFSALRDLAPIFELVELVGNGTYKEQFFFQSEKIRTHFETNLFEKFDTNLTDYFRTNINCFDYPSSKGNTSEAKQNGNLLGASPGVSCSQQALHGLSRLNCPHDILPKEHNPVGGISALSGPCLEMPVLVEWVLLA
ncbi:hypothetical protein HGM15179_004531 [Zosterops borbonicus]|uniref:Uncharacterized protein n=1 Tax=Zosterops borbonicus TaxID=364589 RepID=A0A8K1LQN7_9PASS|nr:hypothetical protein HGM15179_004531 [Zosterops borbonicus]